MINKSDTILVTGNSGFVGKNLVPLMTDLGYNVITSHRTNLLNQLQVDAFFEDKKPDYVINLAAKVGGIQANINEPFKFLYENLMIQNNIIYHSIKYNVKKVINLGSSCIYPKDFSLQPLKEEYLMKSELEETNMGYALAKICGMKLGEYANKDINIKTKFINLIPSNLYGKYDNYNLETSHALASIILKVYNAISEGKQEISIWGNGLAKREWLNVEDLCDCIIWSLENIESTDTFLNVGTGEDISMNELALKIINSFKNRNKKQPNTNSPYFDNFKITNDISRPSGMLKKCLDVSKINNLGWKSKISLEEGLEKTITSFLYK